MSEGLRARFVERYGRNARRPAIVRILDDAATIESYLRRNSIFIPTSVYIDYIAGWLKWDRPKAGAEFQILVKSFKGKPRPLKMCGSTVIENCVRPLTDLFNALRAGTA